MQIGYVIWGPYVVAKVLPHDRYVVRDVDNCQITQIPYNGIIESKNMRLWRSPEFVQNREWTSHSDDEDDSVN
uniref:Uncharacterized protein n=1 Tax=Phlebotomus papatasi TaxID=29031 RepID=A0A1B0CYU2_PHLPP